MGVRYLAFATHADAVLSVAISTAEVLWVSIVLLEERAAPLRYAPLWLPALGCPEPARYFFVN
jgi:hypothetical protein